VRPSLAATAVVLALLPTVANGESLWSALLSNTRLSDTDIQEAATAIVTQAKEMNLPLPPSPLSVVTTILTTWTPPAAPEGVPSTMDPAGIPVDTAQWAPQAKVTVHARNPEDGDTGFETTPVIVVSDDGQMVYVKASDDTLEYPFPKAEIELRPVVGGRRRRTVRRRKTFRRKT
jgi:hypothetical protein